jgi:hypothetical protein
MSTRMKQEYQDAIPAVKALRDAIAARSEGNTASLARSSINDGAPVLPAHDVCERRGRNSP